MAEILLQKPQAGQALVHEAQSDDSINIEFAADSATLSRDGDSLVFSFDDGSSISLANFYTAYSSENMPEFVIEGAAVPGEAFFATLSEDLMPAAGISAPALGSGDPVDFANASLHGGLDALGGLDGNTPAATPVAAQNAAPVITPEGTTQETTQNSQNVPSPVQTQASTQSQFSVPTQQTETQSTSTTPDGVVTPGAPVIPGEPAPSFATRADFLAADAGATLTGNLLANDQLPEGSIIADMEAPEGWTKTVQSDGTIVFVYDADGVSTFEISPTGDYILKTNIDNVGADDFIFNYTAQDTTGNTYSSAVTVGDDKGLIYEIEHLEGDSAIIYTRDENSVGNEYTQDFSDYSGDSEVGNQHVSGVLMGAGDDHITVGNAIGTQGDVTIADKNGEDTFIYGDALENVDAGKVGNDTINITNLDGTKIRADGNLYKDVVGGDDEVNVENMEGGSILGDGWTLHSGSAGGDDTINVDTMSGGSIYGEGMTQYSGAQGGDDVITVNKIDTSASEKQSVIIDGDSGNDTITVGSITSGSGDTIKIDGGLGTDVFNYNSSEDDTMALLGNNIYIAGNNASITNFEGVKTGGGDDLFKLYNDPVNGFTIDTGEGSDVILADDSSKSSIEDMIANNQISNAEFIVFSDDLNNSSTKSTEDLFNKIDGVTNTDGQLSFDANSGWTQGESVGNYDSFTNADTEITILVAKTQMENTPS